MKTRAKHTAEPWVFSQSGKDDDRGIILNGGDMRPGQYARLVLKIATVNLTIDGGVENGRRIIACVNACAGIRPEAVPLMLAALEKIAAESCNHGPGEICPGEIARAAVFAATGGA
jgi:hypothetical protein